MATGLFGGTFGRRPIFVNGRQIDPRLVQGAISGTPFNPSVPMGGPAGPAGPMDAAPVPANPSSPPLMNTLMQAGNIGKPGDGMAPERAASARPRGLFGGRGSQRVANAGPSFFEWLMLGAQAPDILDQRRMRRELFDRGTRDDKIAEDLRMRRDEWARGQTDDPLAALDPEGAIEGERAVTQAQRMAPIEAENALLSRGYRRGENGEYERFGPAADEWAINQEQLRISRVNAARQAAGQRELSSRDAIRVDEAADQARTARRVHGLVQEFLGLNSRVATGPGSNVIASRGGVLPGVFNEERQRMNAITNELTPMMRQGLPGAASDRDMETFRGATVRTGASGSANERTGRAMQAMAQNSIDYAAFIDQYSGGGDLRGAEEFWQSYLDANPIYDSYGNLRSDRPTFQQWMAAGGPDMSRFIAPNEESYDRAASDEDLQAELGGEGDSDAPVGADGFPTQQLGPADAGRVWEKADGTRWRWTGTQWQRLTARARVQRRPSRNQGPTFRVGGYGGG